MIIEELLRQRSQVEERLMNSIPDTDQYNELYRQWAELNTEIVFFHKLAEEQADDIGN
jgi:hypothetical protein